MSGKLGNVVFTLDCQVPIEKKENNNRYWGESSHLCHNPYDFSLLDLAVTEYVVKNLLC